MKLLKQSSRLGKLVVTPPYSKNQPTKGLVWFLHGTCDSGPGLRSWVYDLLYRDFSFYNQQVLYPTAPLIPYDLLNGQVSCVWYNRLKLSPEIPEDARSIESTARSLETLIKEQTERNGIPLSKVVIGGFSQGGSMALHLAYRLHPEVAGCFALSSFLPPDSRIYDTLEKRRERMMARENNGSETSPKNESSLESQSQMLPQKEIPSAVANLVAGKSNKLHIPSWQQETPAVVSTQETPTNANTEKTQKLPPLFMSHGTHDPLVLHSWGKSTFSRLTDHGVSGQFYTIRKLDHTLNHVQLHLLHNWISRVLQDKPPTILSPDGIKPGSKGHTYNLRT